VSRSDAEGRPRRVLLVEDNEVNQALAMAILARVGCHADVADNGQQAVERVERARYGLVLMDCQLPVLDGYQATAEIRRREGPTRHTPIVAMTAGVPEDRRRCLAAGMDDHIAKPVLLGEVQATLSRWLGIGATIPTPGGTAVAVPSGGAVLEESRLTELGRLDAMGNGAALVSRLVECFLDRIPVDLADLRAALDQDDAARVARIAHRLRGAAGTVGSSGMVALCEQLEVLAQTGSTSPTGELLCRLEQEFHRVIRALEVIVMRQSHEPGEGPLPRLAHGATG
jgi:CheY-like chemotaxis protein/HPt (histidine-containing phosphotransfer) domain-containing protein